MTVFKHKVDIILILFIVVSVGVIAQRIYRGKASHSALKGISQTAPAAPQGATTDIQSTEFVLTDFSSVVASAEGAAMKAGQRLDTPGCRNASTPGFTSLIFPLRVVGDAIKNGKLNFIMGPWNNGCYHVGQRIKLVYINLDEPDSPLAEMIGEAVVENVIVVNADQIPFSVLKSIGLDRQSYAQFFGLRELENFVVFKNFVKRAAVEGQPLGAPMLGTIVLDTEGFARRKMSSPIVDLTGREPGKSAVTLLPFKNLPSSGPNFTWSLKAKTIQQLKSDLPDLTPLMNQANVPKEVIVLAPNTEDLSGIALTDALRHLGYLNVYVHYSN